MEDSESESEWAIQEYPASKTTMVKWVLNMGYAIGKKVVISGFIISSAPLVLPPLMVLSAMGFACSVPFGVVFASYACTNKLMSKLLPTPPPPLLLECYAYEEQLEDILDDYREKEDEDEKMKRESVMSENGDGYDGEVESLTTNADGDMDEKKVVKVQQEEDENVLKEQEISNEKEDEEVVAIENVNEEEEGTQMRVSSADEKGYEEDDSLEEGRSVVDVNTSGVEVVTVEIGGDDEREEMVKGSNGLLENIRNEAFEEPETEPEPEPVTVKEMEEDDEREEILKGSSGLLENISNEEPEPVTVKKMEEDDEREEILKGSSGLLEQIRDAASNPNSNGVFASNSNKNEEVEPVTVVKMAGKKQVRSKEDDGLQEKGMDLKHSKADANFLTLKGIDGEDQDLPTFRLAPLDAMTPPSKEENLDDEKMWEKIGALRAIVGYKAACQATCMAEIKALYVFTGVEPPASFEANSCLDEVNSKLKFLMSIVGVK